MAQRCVLNYVDSFKQLVPSNVIIKSCTQVLNYYSEDDRDLENDPQLEHEHETDDNKKRDGERNDYINNNDGGETDGNDFYKCLFSIEVLEDTENEKFT